MTVYYVGPGGSDGAAGTSWATRKATLNGAEDIPVTGGDIVYVGPGTYRETLTCDVSGSSGNQITYVGDVTGAYTDGVGGIVRVTGSNDDQSATRDFAIDGNTYEYRTFRGFILDSTVLRNINDVNEGWVVEDCITAHSEGDGMEIEDNITSPSFTIRRCMFLNVNFGIALDPASATNAVSLTIEDCIFQGVEDYAIDVSNLGGFTVKNCTFRGCDRAIATRNTIGTTITVENCIFTGCPDGINCTTSGDVTENYNSFSQCDVDTTNTSGGANSNTYYNYVDVEQILVDGLVIPQLPFGTLASWSPLNAITGSSASSDDFYGRTRPTTAAKKGWGAVQHQPLERETTTTYDGSTASLAMPDASRVQFRRAVTDASTTISVRVYREANYAGTLPQMIIKQPGQSDRTTTDTGSASTWNQLSDTFTPAATPGYVIIELVSNNTATSGSYAVMFDSLVVS